MPCVRVHVCGRADMFGGACEVNEGPCCCILQVIRVILCSHWREMKESGSILKYERFHIQQMPKQLRTRPWNHKQKEKSNSETKWQRNKRTFKGTRKGVWGQEWDGGRGGVVWRRKKALLIISVIERNNGTTKKNPKCAQTYQSDWLTGSTDVVKKSLANRLSARRPHLADPEQPSSSPTPQTPTEQTLQAH